LGETVDWVVIRGLYRRYPTVWYVWHDEEGRKVDASTRKRELPGPPQWVIRLWRGDSRLIVACPSCREAHDYWVCSDLKEEAAERARDCREFEELWSAFRRYRELVARALKGDPGANEEAERCARRARTREQAAALLRLAEVFGLRLSERAKARLVAKAL